MNAITVSIHKTNHLYRSNFSTKKLLQHNYPYHNEACCIKN